MGHRLTDYIIGKDDDSAPDANPFQLDSKPGLLKASENPREYQPPKRAPRFTKSTVSTSIETA